MSSLTAFQKELQRVVKDAKRKPGSVRFLIASKYFEVEEILKFYNQGIRDFGENRIQEAQKKMELLPDDIRWHFLGHIQSNKISKIKNKFCLLHSIDSFSIAQKLSLAIEKKQPVLIQIKTSLEPTKTGLSPLEFKEVYPKLMQLDHIEIKGLMTVAPKGDEGLARASFKTLRLLKEEFKKESWELSMGMSQDYKTAVEEGATLLRIGRILNQK